MGEAPRSDSAPAFAETLDPQVNEHSTRQRQLSSGLIFLWMIDSTVYRTFRHKDEKV